MLWGQIHGPIYTRYFCLLWVQIHGPIYTLYLCLLWGQIHDPWFHLHPVLVSVLGSNHQIHGPIYTQPILVIKSMVPFTPCICVCCGVKCMVPFTPCTFVCCGVNPWSDLHPVLVIKSMVPSCTCVLVSVVGSNSCSHLHLYTLYFWLLWGQIHGLIYTLYM